MWCCGGSDCGADATPTGDLSFELIGLFERNLASKKAGASARPDLVTIPSSTLVDSCKACSNPKLDDRTQKRADRPGPLHDDHVTATTRCQTVVSEPAGRQSRLTRAMA